MQDIIQAALMLDQHALNWQLELSPEDGRTFAQHCLSYNRSTRENVTALVEMVDQAVPPMNFGGDNPNNGKPCHYYRVGNESSRVIYLLIYKGLAPKLDWIALEKHLGHIAKECCVDEYWVTVNDDTKLIYRFWWD